MSEAHYFIGIPLSPTLQQSLSSIQNEIAPYVSYKKWTNHQDFHITLTFLGGVAENKVEELRDRMSHLRQVRSAFSLPLKGVGTFGERDQPRVLWAGVEKVEALVQLYTDVSEECERAGYPKERRSYSPHITLAKKWKGDQQLHKPLEEVVEFEETYFVDHFSLFRIHPNRNPMYEEVEKFKLEEEA
ncbi:2'-5' RNA ligase [Pontibacillus chungwhensis BH030062]|uniref:RNA 2',3'-cyclic phosphodiesterase n=1 Tax=Pontibacillus chungwhensis BH030062 TaxID=1385513 RepID=A0A0A2UQH3_9BACI|nr:RNA 2',3'-cyclic phosphodiesterase [Pontibacillus chungwhensis]KGP90199.1 2'-5' RNA ligase [Pontibacillus chungwhensis BH030062]